MSLLNVLTTAVEERGRELIDGKGSEGVDRLLREGRAHAGTLAKAVSEILPGSEELTTEAAGAILDTLEKGKGPLLRLTKLGLGWVVGHLANGEEGAAQRVYMETEATLEERLIFQYASGDRAMNERAEREASWEQVKAVLLSIGSVGLEFLSRLLLVGLAI